MKEGGEGGGGSGEKDRRRKYDGREGGVKEGRNDEKERGTRWRESCREEAKTHAAVTSFPPRADRFIESGRLEERREVAGRRGSSARE